MKTLITLLLLGFIVQAYGQQYPALEKVLARELPENSDEDGRWVFYSPDADIEKIEKPLVNAQIPNYDFYKVRLTNYLGYHINRSTCLVLYDSQKSGILLVEPLWYSGVSDHLIQLCEGRKFDSKEALLAFLQEVHELQEVGSVYKFVNPVYTDSLISYDLVHFAGSSITEGNGTRSSTIQYNEDGIWRKIRIDIKDLKIIRYVSMNPKRNNEVD